MARSQDVRSGIFNVKEAGRVSESTYTERIARAEPRLGDLLYSREGTYFGIAAEVPPNVRVCLGQRMVLIRPDPVKLNSRFLRFWLNSPTLAAHIHGFRDGTVAERLNMPTIRALPVPIFDRQEQDAIASILGALDDKIEVNRRMNGTLEAMARAIFQDWFVAFGPTRAKMDGHPPYLAPDLWALFPDRLDDEGKPEGWEASTIGEMAVSEVRACSPDEIAKGTPYIALEHMPRRQIALSDWDTADRVESVKLRFKRGEFLYGKLRPYFHKVGIAPVDGVCTTDAVVLRPVLQSLAAFVLMTISSADFVDFTDRGSTGTKMPRTSWGQMQRYPIVKPSQRATEAFEALVDTMLKKLVANIHESRTLAATRDLLLPRLMSGELRFRDAERAVEAVA